jgi:hypothetical protein
MALIIGGGDAFVKTERSKASMYRHKTIARNRQSWDSISANYQAHTRISTDDVP